MNVSPGAILFILVGIIDLAAGLWAYLGPIEEHGAPRGFKNMSKTWHGRGTVCAALPVGIVFLSLGLASSVDSDGARQLFLYLAFAALLAALFFLLRAPNAIRPHWLKETPQV